MEPKFNINREKVSDEEINKHKDFNKLVQQFKQQSLQKARRDNSWWKNKKVRYSAVIAGVTVICTVTYFSIFKDKIQKQTANETLTTQNSELATNKNISTTNTKKAFINKPSSKLSVNYSSYKVNNQKGGEIKHPSTSKIKVPKNSFVDKNGKEIVGDVTIEYREFHDKGDVILSGIPMAYDSAGKKYNLESAGMFDIKGSQNGEPVFIKPGKDIKVELASQNAENRFNQYFLDTVEQNWTYIKKDIAIPVTKPEDVKPNNSGHGPNSKVELLTKKIDVIIPKQIDSVGVVYTKKTEALPKPKEPGKPSKPTGRPTFKIDGSETEFPELAAFNNVIFEVGSENKNYTKDMHDITWSNVTVSEGPQKGKNYVLTLTYRQRNEKLVVYPVLTGADFEKAQGVYEKKFSEYTSLVKKREADEQKLKAEMEAKQKAYLAEIEKLKKERIDLEIKTRQQDLNNLNNSFNTMSNQVRATRIFSVAQFGIYNSDCTHSMPEGKSVSPIFVLNEKDKPLMPDAIYLINHSLNSVYSFSGYEATKIKYDPTYNYSFVVFQKNKMFLCSKASFLETSRNDGNKFAVTILPEGSENLVDFKKALEI